MSLMADDIDNLAARAAAVLRTLGVTGVYLFGSAAKGTMRPDSDLDLAVTGLPPARYVDALVLLRDAVGRPVDLVDLDVDTPFVRCLREDGDLRRVA